jgi:hypothetical protein
MTPIRQTLSATFETAPERVEVEAISFEEWAQKVYTADLTDPGVYADVVKTFVENVVSWPGLSRVESEGSPLARALSRLYSEGARRDDSEGLCLLTMWAVETISLNQDAASPWHGVEYWARDLGAWFQGGLFRTVEAGYQPSHLWDPSLNPPDTYGSYGVEWIRENWICAEFRMLEQLPPEEALDYVQGISYLPVEEREILRLLFADRARDLKQVEQAVAAIGDESLELMSRHYQWIVSDILSDPLPPSIFETSELATRLRTEIRSQMQLMKGKLEAERGMAMAQVLLPCLVSGMTPGQLRRALAGASPGSPPLSIRDLYWIGETVIPALLNHLRGMAADHPEWWQKIESLLLASPFLVEEMPAAATTSVVERASPIEQPILGPASCYTERSPDGRVIFQQLSKDVMTSIRVLLEDRGRSASSDDVSIWAINTLMLPEASAPQQAEKRLRLALLKEILKHGLGTLWPADFSPLTVEQTTSLCAMAALAPDPHHVSGISAIVAGAAKADPGGHVETAALEELRKLCLSPSFACGTLFSGWCMASSQGELPAHILNSLDRLPDEVHDRLLSRLQDHVERALALFAYPRLRLRLQEQMLEAFRQECQKGSPNVSVLTELQHRLFRIGLTPSEQTWETYREIIESSAALSSSLQQELLQKMLGSRFFDLVVWLHVMSEQDQRWNGLSAHLVLTLDQSPDERRRCLDHVLFILGTLKRVPKCSRTVPPQIAGQLEVWRDYLRKPLSFEALDIGKVPMWLRLFCLERIASGKEVVLRRIPAQELRLLKSLIERLGSFEPLDLTRVLWSTMSIEDDEERNERLAVLELLGPEKCFLKLGRALIPWMRDPQLQHRLDRLFSCLGRLQPLLAGIEPEVAQLMFDAGRLPQTRLPWLVKGWLLAVESWADDPERLALLDRASEECDLLADLEEDDLPIAISRHHLALEQPTGLGVTRWVRWICGRGRSASKTARALRPFSNLHLTGSDIGYLLHQKWKPDAMKVIKEWIQAHASAVQNWLVHEASIQEAGSVMQLPALLPALGPSVWCYLMRLFWCHHLQGSVAEDALKKIRLLTPTVRLEALQRALELLPAQAPVHAGMLRQTARDLLVSEGFDSEAIWSALDRAVPALQPADWERIGIPSPLAVTRLHQQMESGVHRWVSWWLGADQGTLDDRSRDLPDAVRNLLSLGPHDVEWMLGELMRDARLPKWICRRLAEHIPNTLTLFEQGQGRSLVIPQLAQLWAVGVPMHETERVALMDWLSQSERGSQGQMLSSADRLLLQEVLRGWPQQVRTAFPEALWQRVAVVLQLSDRQRHELGIALASREEGASSSASSPSPTTCISPTARSEPAPREILVSNNFLEDWRSLNLSEREEMRLREWLEEERRGDFRQVRPNPFTLDWNGQNYVWDHQHVRCGEGNPLVPIYFKSRFPHPLRLVALYRHDNQYERSTSNEDTRREWVRRTQSPDQFSKWRTESPPASD